ncbi:hypothetical protein JDV02_001975 [Purpureocillium takamizusanense]|uniref:Uncharacterized protein n=1 Tax=Purpureocillium takamizusanense TaxID=2060973 RepID=A0A9Q8V8D2_9HYPO|nr:uncharacterized protein JDV02_001975 [Purpureocillium takamizusanense]UNI15441.1 hypothetical protein JDV02_001975 [Purpureocillium takamizusanense]
MMLRQALSLLLFANAALSIHRVDIPHDPVYWEDVSYDSDIGSEDEGYDEILKKGAELWNDYIMGECDTKNQKCTYRYLVFQEATAQEQACTDFIKRTHPCTKGSCGGLKKQGGPGCGVSYPVGGRCKFDDDPADVNCW